MDISARIIPYKGMGDISLYTHISELYELIDNRKPIARVETDFYIEYEFDNAISLFFNIVNGKLYKITALGNYKGSLDEEVFINMDINSLDLNKIGISYNSKEDFYYKEGVIIETSFEECNGLKDNVDSISIYIKEMDELPEDQWDKIDKGQW